MELKLEKDNSKKMKFKETIFRRDNYKCLMCGGIYNSHSLILYFDTPGGKPTNDTDNIITLCQKCKKLINEGSKWKDEGDRQVSYRWTKEDIMSFSAKQILSPPVFIKIDFSSLFPSSCFAGETFLCFTLPDTVKSRIFR